jgi:magnesium transporter
MARFIKKKKEHIGLSPYAMVFRGKKKTETTLLHAMNFSMDEVQEMDVNSTDELLYLKDSSKLSWINIDGLDNLGMMEEISQVFNLESNILSDVMNPGIRPKVQEFDNGLFITIKLLQYNSNIEHLVMENLSLIATPNTLISFQEQPNSVFDPVRDRIRKHKNKIRTSGSDYLAFALLDIVVDNYIYIIGILGDKIEDLEEQMVADPNKELLSKINFHKLELNFLRKHIKPAKEMILNLSKLSTEFIQDENRIHFKELQDNINEAKELSDSYYEILYDMLSIYHSSMSTKLNEIMRVLTIISVIFIPITFIVGVYGTNFTYLPEKDYHYGYFIMWGIMILISLGMILFFKKKRWF